jgi:predicted transcriptional regulator
MIRITKKPDGSVIYECATASEFQIVQRGLTSGHFPKKSQPSPQPPVSVSPGLVNGAAKLFAAIARSNGEITSDELRKTLGVDAQELGNLFKDLRLQLAQRAKLKLSDLVQRKRLIRAKQRVRVYTLTKKGERLVKDMGAE